MSKKFLGLAIIVLAALALIYWGQGEPDGKNQKEGMQKTGEPIKIGVLLPLTGDAGAYGESENRAILVAVEEINNAGGIAGSKIELVTEDGKCDPQAGGTAAQKLVEVNKVKVIIGGACSGETLAAAKITEPAKVILLSPSASSPKVTEAGDFVFRTYPSDSLAGQIAARYASTELKAKKAALLTELTDYAQGLREVYRNAFVEAGGEVVADETYNTGDVDFRTQILKIKQQNPDVIYAVPQSPTPGVALFKQMRENGVTAAFTTAEVLMDRQVVKDNAQILEGLVGVEVAIDYENNAKAKAFKAAHGAKFNQDPGSFAANAYDAVYLLKEAIARNGLDTEKIRDFLYAVKDWDGAIGSISMDRNGDPVMGENVRKVANGEVTDLGAYQP